MTWYSFKYYNFFISLKNSKFREESKAVTNHTDLIFSHLTTILQLGSIFTRLTDPDDHDLKPDLFELLSSSVTPGPKAAAAESSIRKHDRSG